MANRPIAETRLAAAATLDGDMDMRFWRARRRRWRFSPTVPTG
jgi:hypothetical protein